MANLKKYIAILNLCLMFGLLSSFNYQDEWESVDKTARQNPKTALTKVQNIETQARKEKNNPQLLRCVFRKISLKGSFEDASFGSALDELHVFQKETTDPVALAVSRYLEAVRFSEYYNQDKWNIDRRKELTDVVPDDIDEWTTNLFRQKIRDLISLAIAEPAIRTVKAADYEALIVLGDDSRIYRPTLYDFLMYAFLENRFFFIEPFTREERVKMYDDLAGFHAADADKSAYVAALLLGLDYKLRERFINQEECSAALNNMLKGYYNDPASMLVRKSKAHFLQNHFNDKEEDRRRFGAYPSNAISLCEEGVEKFPKHPVANELKGLVTYWNNKNVKIGLEHFHVHKGDSVKMKVSYANITDLKVTLFRYNCSVDEFYNTDRRKLPKKKVADFEFKLNKSDYCVKKDTVVEIPAQDYGAYVIGYDGKFASFVVSDQFVFFRNQTSTEHQSYFVVDSKNGAPKENVTVNFVDDYNNRESKEQKTDANGECVLNKKKYNGNIHLEEGNDTYFQSHISVYDNTFSFIDNEEDCHVAILTDRSIYRPGQTVYFKCIAYSVKEKGSSVNSKYPLVVKLLDANYQEVANVELQTNSFGSASSSFVIPASALCGYYTINVENEGSSCSIRVEEYKRPTFDVALYKPEGTFTFGDSVCVKGKASYLLGTPVQGAKVAYTIKRKPNYFFRWGFSVSGENVVCDSEVMTDNEGNFSINFVPKKMSDDYGRSCYDYEVLVKVTDVNGESHEETRSVTVGDESIAIVCPQKERLVFRDLETLNFSVMSLNYLLLEKTVDYKVMRDSVVVTSGQVVSSAKEGFSLKLNTDAWTSGKYSILFSTLDDKNRKVERMFETVLYRENDKCPPVETVFWTENLGSYSVEPGEEKKVRVGSSCKDAHLLVVWNFQNGISKKQWYTLNNEIREFAFSLGKNDDVLNVMFFMVNEASFYHRSLMLNKKKPEMDIPVKLTVFRDKVLPGAKEKWQIQMPANKPAEVLAAMYDASLNQFESHSWPGFIHYDKSYMVPYYNYIWSNAEGLYKNDTYHYIACNFQFDRWRMLGFFNARPALRHADLLCSTEMAIDNALAGRVPGVQISNDAPRAKQAKMLAGGQPGAAAEAAVLGSEERDLQVPVEETKQQSKPESQMKVRSNFAETAFFYPNLTADKEGNVNVEFTMPESLTEWSFMAFAHTNDLFSGSLTQKIVSQKDFMVSPNYPRFLRNGDVCVLSAKVINLTGGKCSGMAKLQLLDPVSEAVVIEKSTDFTLEDGMNGAVEWEISVPRKVEAFLVRVSAASGNFTDAEQKLLPVLSDRMVLTQTMPMYVRGGNTKDFTFQNLVDNKSTTLDNRFMKLEMATNPIWYAVQALPSVAKADHENAVSLSAAFFASKMAQHIANSNPRIFKVIELWKQQGGDKQTLLSNLEKNTEVKNVLLNETPWVLDAKNETENKQRISALFDLNTLGANCDTWLNKLNELQEDDGGFSWFKGMKSNLYTTLFVLDNFGRLRKAGIKFDETRIELRKAAYFTDDCVRKEYEWLKKYEDYEKTAHVSTTELYYFQVRSMFADIPVKSDCKKAYDFFYGLVKKQWADFGLSGKALAAMCLYQGGNKAEALKVVRSLREFSTSSEEMGMYWARNASYYLWQNAAIGTHTRIMEALQLVDPNPAEQDELRIWLLNQKRTQNWDGVVANIDALNVLLLGNTWLDHENKVTVKMGNKVVDPSQNEAATGYYSIFVPGNQINPEMGKVQLQSAEGGNLSWGAMYWQFEENIDKVKNNNTALGVDKTVMLQTVENGKDALKTIDANSKLKVGDKLVVRLVLRTDRDLEYVCLKDQRASCLEPLQTLSGYRYSEHTGYYQSVKDAAMYYFFDHLSKGTYVFEYPLVVTNKGSFSNGITSVQCLYAPEFSTNTGSVKINVK